MDYQDATLKTKFTLSKTNQLESGLHELDLNSNGRDGLIFIPRNAKGPMPLIVLLHGAGGKASQMLVPFRDLAEVSKTVLLIPESRAQTWDIIMGKYGPDVKFIDQALAKVFKNIQIDSDKIAISGFSDGASYALSLGIPNGDLFSHIMAYSPGFMAPPSKQGSPSIFVTHGSSDKVLNIDACSRKLVPLLKTAKFDVLYREFEGGHTMPPEFLKEAFNWFLKTTEELKDKVKKTRTPINQNELRKT